MKASWDYERQFWGEGITLIAGVDEAGMGAWAGPVCAAVVVFGPDLGNLAGVRDSKTLSAAQREAAVEMIQGLALDFGIGEASAAEIDALNIRQAAHLAMRRAVANLTNVPELLLIDGNPAQPHEAIPAVNIVKGDSLSYSIAAASILAKVHRDTIMADLEQHLPGYGFGQHKGYGTATHLLALQQLGVTTCHRRSYAPVRRILETIAGL